MYVSTVELETAAHLRDVSSVPFCHWHGMHYFPITGMPHIHLICNLMEILNEVSAHLSGHTE